MNTNPRGIVMKLVIAVLILIPLAFSQTMTDYPTQIKRKSIVDPREYKAVCNGVTDDTVAITAVEALTDTRDVFVPPPGCAINSSLYATLNKHYVGPGKLLILGTGGALLAPDYTIIRTQPAPTDYTLGNFQGSQKGVDARYFQTVAGANIGSVTSPYFNYGINIGYWTYESDDGASGYDTITTGTSNSGQPVLTVRSTAAFSTGKQVIINGIEIRTISSIQAGVSLTMTANLTTTHLAGEYVTMKNRTSQSNLFLKHVNAGGGDSQTIFLEGYGNTTPGPDVRHWSENATMTLTGGSIGLWKDFNGGIINETLITDQQTVGEARTNAVGLILNLNRFAWAGQVNTATGTNIVTLVSTTGKFFTSWAAGTSISITGATCDPGCTIASVTDQTHLVLNQDPGNHTNVYYRVDTTVGVNGSWSHMYLVSGGTQYDEQAIQLTGKYKVGFSTVGTDLLTTTAYTMAPDQKICYNGSTTPDADVGYALWTKTPGSVCTYYNQSSTQWRLIFGGTVTFSSTTTDVFVGNGITFNSGGNLLMGTTRDITVPNIKSTTGQRYVCVDTAGKLVSSTSACSGT